MNFLKSKELRLRMANVAAVFYVANVAAVLFYPPVGTMAYHVAASLGALVVSLVLIGE